MGLTPEDIQIDDLSATQSVPDSVSDDPSGGNRTHYKTLEEADSAARRFQSELDKRTAELDRWKPLNRWEALGSPEAINQLINEVVELHARPDFQAYRNGKLGEDREEPEEDDQFLSDEQREIRDLRKRLEERDGEQRSQQSQVNGELASLRFERAEKEVQAQLGDHWGSRREQVLGEVRRLVANGSVRTLDAVTPKLLFKAWAASFNDFDDFNASVTKMVLDNESKRISNLNDRSTLPPSTLSPGRAPSAAPKSFKDAFEIGWSEAVQAGRV